MEVRVELILQHRRKQEHRNKYYMAKVAMTSLDVCHSSQQSEVALKRDRPSVNPLELVTTS